MGTPTQEIIRLSKLADKSLFIPDYQRPYKWKSEHVVRLLDDIIEHVVVGKKIYRIGSIILHNNDIVDGQQRLTTISILLKLLKVKEGLLLQQKYKHTISKDNIVYNARVISNWLSKITDREHFKTLLLENCEFVLFTVFNQDEAFQLFDSQNARGKALEPYDLLKAFHLREMEHNNEEERIICVQRWEKSIEDDTLKPILANHLFKIRKWSKNSRKYDFTKNDIDEFKGISLQQKQKYPFESSIRMLDGLIENAQKDHLLKNLQIAQNFPFSITMTIINGKRFFEYVDYYILLKDNVFSKEGNASFYNFYNKQCFGYDGYRRSGDEKVRNLYENIVLMFIDKFSYTEDFEHQYKAFYKATYIIRCNEKAIRFETILNAPAKNILQEINDSIHPEKLRKYQIKTYITKEEHVKGIEIVKNFIDGTNS